MTDEPPIRRRESSADSYWKEKAGARENLRPCLVLLAILLAAVLLG